MNYEELMIELENIIYKLEDGNTKFDDATKLFERGAEICKNLNKNLEETEVESKMAKFTKSLTKAKKVCYIALDKATS